MATSQGFRPHIMAISVDPPASWRLMEPRSKFLPWNMGLLGLKALVSLGVFLYLTATAPRYFNDFVVKNQIPESFANKSLITAGQGIAAVIGPLGLAWNVWTFIYATDWKAPWWYFLWMIVECIIGSLLLIAAVLQSFYLPHTLERCSSAEHSRLFLWASQLWGQSPNINCRGWVAIWIMCIVGGILSSLGSVLGFRLVLVAKTEYFNPEAIFRRIPYEDWKLDLLARFIDTWVPQTVIILPRVLYRYLQKWQAPPLPAHSVPHLQKSSKYSLTLAFGYANVPHNSNRMLELLSTYPIRVALLEESNLCYTDVLNLASCSRGAWTAMFTNPDSDTQIRKHSCQDSLRLQPSKKGCWSCNNQTCESCVKEVFLPGDLIEKHATDCDAYCTSCYMFYMSTAELRFDVPWHCTCTEPKQPGHFDAQTPAQEPAIIVTAVAGVSSTSPFKPQRDISLCDVGYRRRLCINCAKLSPTAAVAKRSEWSKQLVAEKNRKSKCGGCSVDLKRGGVRWWGCGYCRRECQCDLHTNFDMTERSSGSVESNI